MTFRLKFGHIYLVALTILVDRRAMLPSVTEVGIVKSPQMHAVILLLLLLLLLRKVGNARLGDSN